MYNTSIRYILIKQASTETHVAFRNFASRYLKIGKILLKQKIEQTYSIFKDINQYFNLSNIRPIVFLKIFRKCITKVYTTRLKRIIRKNNILEEFNFTRLVDSSTESLIHILNIIIEKIKEKNKEL